MKTALTWAYGIALILATINADNLPNWAFNLTLIAWVATIVIGIINIEKRGR